MKRIFLLCLMINFTIKVFSQDTFPDFTQSTNLQPIPPYEQLYEGFYLIKLASDTFCKKDTLKAIQLLKKYVEKFPKGGMLQSAQLAIGDMYLKMGNLASAKLAFNAVFALKPDELYLGYRDNSCDLIAGILNPKKILFQNCLKLYLIAIKESKFDDAKLFLEMATKKHFPPIICGNEYNMYLCQLTPYLADYQLVMKDTTEAIKLYLTAFFNHEGSYSPGFIEKTKKILSLKYTNRRVKLEIQDGLKNLSFEKYMDGIDERMSCNLKIFNTSILISDHYEKDIIKLKEWIQKDLDKLRS